MEYLLRFGAGVLGIGCLGGVAWTYNLIIGWLYAAVSAGDPMTGWHIAAIIGAVLGLVPAYFAVLAGIFLLVVGLLGDVFSISYNK